MSKENQKTKLVRVTETVTYEVDMPSYLKEDEWEDWFCNQDLTDSPSVHFVEVSDRDFELASAQDERKEMIQALDTEEDP